MPRAQNSHAHVNAGFLFKLDAAGMILDKPNIIFGGIRPDFVSTVISRCESISILTSAQV